MTELTWQQRADENHLSLLGELSTLPNRPGATRRATIALAWHDIVCPEAVDCRDRHLHAASHPIAYGGLLERFIERAKELGAEL